jgi:hypothetical protein
MLCSSPEESMPARARIWKSEEGEEGDVVVVLLSGAVVCSPREGVWFTHAPTGFVVEEEVKA